MQNLALDQQKIAELTDELAKTRDPPRVKGLVEKIAELNEKEHGMLAFKDPATGMTDWSKWMASTYHDELAGGANGSFRYWFICKAGGKQWPCNTAVVSEMWGRKHAPGVPKNKWKCTVCSANFLTKFGCLV